MATLGFLYLILLFLCCFAVVHFIKLAVVGFQSLKKKPAEEKKPPEPKQEKPPKPVYYIVERKRAKRNYSEPREIEFK